MGANIRSDLEASLQIARWAYGQAFAAQSMVWVRAKELRLLGGLGKPCYSALRIATCSTAQSALRER